MGKIVYVINGPNLNLLGKREPAIYGADTLEDVERETRVDGLETQWMQSNWEGQIIDWIQEARTKAAAIVINPGGYSHTSVAIHDALRAFDGPVIEVHVSNIHAREEFRHKSMVSLCATSIIIGCGVQGYDLALRRVAALLGQKAGA